MMSIPDYAPPAPPSPDERPFREAGYETKSVTMSKADLLAPDGKSTIVLVTKLGWSAETDGPTLQHAIPSDFLTFLREKDTDHSLADLVATSLEGIAKQLRNGELAKED
jgi:hypothetical protein